MKLTFLTAVLCAVTVCSVPAFSQTDTTFTYQGQLNEAGVPADGLFDLEFSLFDSLVGGSQVGSTVTIVGQSVSDGTFSSLLDFGAQDFSGTQYWIEIVVDSNTLSPRQPIVASPYSIQTRGIFVDDAGNVGIGTGDPGFPLLYPLHVVSHDLASIRVVNTKNGTGYGVHATTEGTVGAVGVIGTANASSGSAYGGQFTSKSSSGRGVLGLATATTGITYGVYSASSSTSGRGVYGEATAGTGETYGGRFESNSSSGRGVFGKASASSGTTYGGQFESSSSSGRGVFGRARASSGLTDGVFGQSDSTSGRGLCGWAPVSSGTTYGVYGTSNSTSGTGVFGGVQATTGITYGGRFEADSNVGRGVFGFASANSGVNYGVVGHSNSSSGFDFWASGAGTNYGSPSSRRFKSNIVPIGNPLDKLAKLRGVYFDWDQDHGSAHDVGMIAEEVGGVMPEIVQYEENGVDAIGMDYSKLTPLLVEATNALRVEKDAEIKRLEDNMTRLQLESQLLKARLDRLERMMALLVDR